MRIDLLLMMRVLAGLLAGTGLVFLLITRKTHKKAGPSHD